MPTRRWRARGSGTSSRSKTILAVEGLGVEVVSLLL